MLIPMVAVQEDRRLMQWVLDQHNRAVDMVIVTNPGHERQVQAIGGRTFVCPDPLPNLDDQGAVVEVEEKSVFLICSFDKDEPFLEAFAAFEELVDDGYTLYVSGNPASGGIDPQHYPWVRFLGFIPDEKYAAYLRHCAVAMEIFSNCADPTFGRAGWSCDRSTAWDRVRRRSSRSPASPPNWPRSQMAPNLRFCTSGTTGRRGL